MKWNKKEIIAAALLFCVSCPAFAADVEPAASETPLAIEEVTQARQVQFVVREDTVVELDGEVLKGPSEVKGTTWFFDVPELKLGRHHLKLTHPRTNSWEGDIVVTEDEPEGEDGHWNLTEKLDYGHYQKQK